MAKNPAPVAPLLSPKERALRAIQAGDAALALKLVREAHAATPTPEALADRKQVLAIVAGYFADRDKAVDFNRVMAEADQIDPTEPAWAMERACLLARGGRRDDALARVGVADHPRILGHAVDRAIRMRTKEFLPDELTPGFDAVMAGFKKHEAGDEAGARAAVDPIGIRSPFLDWKLLIRGLLAHANADDARAAENFGRLDPTRLPARLAAPLRVGVDPAFKASLPTDVATDLSNKAQPFTATAIVDLLRKIAKELGRDKPLTPAFRAADEVLPHLKKAAPQLIPKLANCMYAAILQQGQPEDMGRYRKLFGNPPDDPHFHKLQAIIGEGMDEYEMAHTNWQKYEAWLATKPAGWSEAVATRARSLVWHRMGENALEASTMEEDEEDEDDDDDDDYMFPPFGPRGGGSGLPRPPLTPSASECFRQVNRLAPDWAEGAKHFMTSLVLEEKFDEAEAIARKFLAGNPNDLEMLTVLGNMLLAQGRPNEAITFRLQALAVNPLDKALRARTTFAVLATSRYHLTKGDAPAANALLEQHQSLVQDQPGPLAVIRSTILTKLGQSAEAVAARAQALAIENFRLAGAYRIAVDGILAKLKPAEKKITDKVFTTELAKPPTAGELVQLFASLEMYETEGVNYRGQKTHAKKALDLVPKLKATSGAEIDFERLADMLVIREEWKAAKKYTDLARRWFPRNPIFPMLRAKIGHALNESPYSLIAILHEARHNAESSTDPRFKAMTERIDEIQGEVGSPMDLFDMFFRGRRR